MIKFLEKIDSLFLVKIVTPLAHDIQRRYGLANYTVGELLMELTAVTYLLMLIHGIWIQKNPVTWWNIIDGAPLVWLAIHASHLRKHMERSDWWKVRPLYSTQAMPEFVWGGILCIAILATFNHGDLLLQSVGNHPFIKINGEEKRLYTIYFAMGLILAWSFPMGFYFARVLPLPPSYSNTETGKPLSTFEKTAFDSN